MPRGGTKNEVHNARRNTHSHTGLAKHPCHATPYHATILYCARSHHSMAAGSPALAVGLLQAPQRVAPAEAAAVLPAEVRLLLEDVLPAGRHNPATPSTEGRGLGGFERWSSWLSVVGPQLGCPRPPRWRKKTTTQLRHKIQHKKIMAGTQHK